jgi:L-cysteine:1D-myo-inositol 2-amino-2-deoxy-alpha-D-glucopyranoside ligase
MVYHEGEKMSKSLGNLVMVRDLLQDWSPDALRLYLASHHYRTSWSYAEADLAQAARLAEKLSAAFQAGGGSGPALDPAAAQIAFSQGMDHDLNVPDALSALDKLAGEIITAAKAGQDIRTAQATLGNLGQVFGLRLGSATPERRVLTGWAKHLERFSESAGA